MKLIRIKKESIFTFCMILMFTVFGSHLIDAQENVMGGITMVAPPSEIGEKEIQPIVDVNANWIALVPYGFSSSVTAPEIRYNLSRQWWGEREEGIRQSIKLAHQKGLKVMLKPQVYIHGGWVGDVNFNNEEDWKAWEEGYRKFIQFYANLAAEEGVEMLCIATEYKLAVKNRPQFWRSLIKEIRGFYDGKIIYSSNWDGYENISIWDDLDYIGISAYFPLTDQKTPTKNNLLKKWAPIKRKLKSFSEKYNKAIIFTEYGYLTTDHCAWRAWELEKVVRQQPINEPAQANAYDSILRSFWNEEWWAGGFLWKWFPGGMGHEGYPERDYTPQGKLSEEVIKEWYGKSK